MGSAGTMRRIDRCPVTRAMNRASSSTAIDPGLARSRTWLVVGLISATSGCAPRDDRPETLACVTETILAPSCALAECHSAMTRVFNYAFDNVELAQEALDGTDALRLIGPCAAPPCSTSPDDSYLIQVITSQDIYGNRMPDDSSMPGEDVQLIIDWIRDGATGYIQPGVP